MGLYPIPCKICKKVFMWFSGNPIQLCGECSKTAVIKKEKTDSDKGPF